MVWWEWHKVKSTCCDREEAEWIQGHRDMVAQWYWAFCERNDFIFNPFRNFKPVKRFQIRSDVLQFWSLDNSSSKRILNVSETIYLIFWKTGVPRVRVVKLGVYGWGGNCFGSVKIKVGTDTAKSTDVMVAWFKQCRDMIRVWEMFIKYVAKVASRLSSVYWSRRVVNICELPFKSY